MPAVNNKTNKLRELLNVHSASLNSRLGRRVNRVPAATRNTPLYQLVKGGIKEGFKGGIKEGIKGGILKGGIKGGILKGKVAPSAKSSSNKIKDKENAPSKTKRTARTTRAASKASKAQVLSPKPTNTRRLR
jgi:hypothetical protein